MASRVMMEPVECSGHLLAELGDVSDWVVGGGDGQVLVLGVAAGATAVQLQVELLCGVMAR